METEQDLNTTWTTADSSEPSGEISIQNDAQADAKQLFVDKKYLSLLDCEEKWKVPDSSVMNTVNDLEDQNIMDCVTIKEETPDEVGLPLLNVSNIQMTINDVSIPYENLGQNFVPGAQFAQQELVPVDPEQAMSYSYPQQQQQVYQKTPNDCNYCTECEKSFSCNRSFRRHMLVHTGARPFHCKDCGRAFSRKDSLLAHERRHRRRTTHFRHQCSQCGINFLNSFQLKNHEQLHSSSSTMNQGDSPGERDELGGQASRAYMLDGSRPTTANYEALTQSSINPLVSVSDGMPFDRKVSVSDTMPSDKKVYKCQLCRKTFSKQYALHFHMNTHTSNFHCEHCGKVFRFRRNKQVHMLKFHSKYQCMQCQTNFPNLEVLRTHQHIHRNDGLHTSQFLGAPFNSMQQAQAKVKSHQTGVDRPWQCQCGTSCHSRLEFQKHVHICKHQTASNRAATGYYYSHTETAGNSTNNPNDDIARAITRNHLFEEYHDSKVNTMLNVMKKEFSSEDIRNPILQCNVCSTRLKTPRSLPCTHTFCHKCLENILEKPVCTLSCPMCKKVAVIPSGDLAQLKTNQLISCLLSEAQNAEQQSYPLCIVCDVDASHHCQQCDAFLCMKCSGAHLKLPATKDHTQISLTEYNSKDPRERMAATVIMCKQHDSPSKFFCRSCQKLICVGCTLVDHPKGTDHDITDLSSAFLAFCTATKPILAECEEREAKLCSDISDMEPVLQRGNQRRSKCKKSIQVYVTKLRAVLDNFEEKLLSEVDESSSAKQTIIDGKLVSLKAELEDIKSTILLANQLITSPNNALALTSTADITQHLKDLLQRSAPSLDLDTKSLKFTPSKDLLAVFQMEGIGALEETDETQMSDDDIEIREVITIE